MLKNKISFKFKLLPTIELVCDLIVLNSETLMFYYSELKININVFQEKNNIILL